MHRYPEKTSPRDQLERNNVWRAANDWTECHHAGVRASDNFAKKVNSIESPTAAKHVCSEARLPSQSRPPINYVHFCKSSWRTGYINGQLNWLSFAKARAEGYRACHTNLHRWPLVDVQAHRRCRSEGLACASSTQSYNPVRCVPNCGLANPQL